MHEKSILIGNGINIAFSGSDDYKNYKIIDRLLLNVNTERYKDIFANKVKPSDLQSIIFGLKKVFKKMLKGVDAIKWTENEDELKTLFEIAKRYNGKSQEMLDVGMEDYFFAMKLFNNSFGDDAVPINALFDGLKILFLDSIYNEGKIESLYLNMECLEDELCKFSNIFTVNYDTNLEKLVPKKVYHLHGSFNVFDDTYNPNTIVGYLAKQKGNQTTYISGLEHLYCNAIMGFSGEYKMSIMKVYSDSNNALNTLVARIKNPFDSEAQQKYQELKNSINENDISLFNSINERVRNPEFKNTEYPIREFEGITGELNILGMSPNNDSHIFKMINENPNISRVIYFSAGDNDTLSVQRIIKKPLQIRNVFKYWKSIGK
jgi:hypothetical protein